MKQLAERVVMPKCLATLKSCPLCAACVFAKSHKRPWRNKNKNKFIRKENENFSGDATLADNMISLKPGLVPKTQAFLLTIDIMGKLCSHVIIPTTFIAVYSLDLQMLRH